jgi:PAS domain S-box-containing protein
VRRAAAAFVRGQNHPAEAERMARFFLRFQQVTYVAEAIRIWTEADQEIARLQGLGAELRRLVRGGKAEGRALERLIAQVAAADGRLTLLEDEFSSTLSEGARFVLAVTEDLLLALAAILLGVGWLYALRVTAEVRRAESALRGSEARYRVLGESMLEGLIILRDGRFLHANPAALRLIGATLEDLIGAEFAPLIHPDFRAFVAERHRRRMAGEQLPPRYDIQILTRAGDTLWVQLANERVDWDGGPAVLTILSDITERKRTEEQVTALNETLERRVAERTAALERSNRELEAFNYSVSHDLRAPVGVISSFATMIRADFERALPEQAKQYLVHIENNAAQMARLIDNLLEFSRMGRAVLVRAPVNMRALVDDVVRQLRQADAHVLPVIGELPPARGDADLLRQVWHNLIGNAVKFSGKAAAPRIEIGYQPAAGGGAYFVRDNGTGFDMKHAAKLFGVFERLHAPAEFEGTGIGLAIAKRVVELHAGKIRAESTPGQGATFWFSLPA